MNPAGEISTSVYTPDGLVAATVTPLDNRSTTLYDANRNPVTAVNPLAFLWTTAYDQAGA